MASPGASVLICRRDTTGLHEAGDTKCLAHVSPATGRALPSLLSHEPPDTCVKGDPRPILQRRSLTPREDWWPNQKAQERPASPAPLPDPFSCPQAGGGGALEGPRGPHLLGLVRSPSLGPGVELPLSPHRCPAGSSALPTPLQTASPSNASGKFSGQAPAACQGPAQHRILGPACSGRQVPGTLPSPPLLTYTPYIGYK